MFFSYGYFLTRTFFFSGIVGVGTSNIICFSLYFFTISTHLHLTFQIPLKGKGKSVPLQAWTGPEVSRKLRFPDFVTTSQDGDRLSALRTGRLYH